MDPKLLKQQAKHLSPVMSIGKSGINPGSVEQLRTELEQKGLVKVKLLRSFLDGSPLGKKEIAAELASYGKAKIIDQVGNVVVLYRPTKNL